MKAQNELNEKQFQIISILIAITDKYDDLPDYLQLFLIKEIIQKQVVKSNAEDENNSLLQTFSILNKIFITINESFNLDEQAKFIQNNFNCISINLQDVEKLNAKKQLKSIFSSLINNIGDIKIELIYKSESYEIISQLIKENENEEEDEEEENCENEKDIKITLIIPEIKSIKWDLANNLSIYKVIIPSSITSIPNDAFDGCSNIRYVECNPYKINNINELFGSLPTLNLIINSSVTSITDNNFNLITNLKKITIPSTVTSINNNAFKDCMKLSEVNIPTSVKSIGNRAFYGCKLLKCIKIPSSVTSIGDYAFYGCSSLSKTPIPLSVKSVGKNAYSKKKIIN